MSTVWNYKPETELLTPEGCYITELSNSASDASCSIALARVGPGVVTQLHCLLDTVERYVIVEGEGRVEVDGKEVLPVQRFDVVNIPAGLSQRVVNVGSGDLLILCICTPRFKPDCYRSWK